MNKINDTLGGLRRFWTLELKLHFYYKKTDKKEVIVNKVYEDNYTIVYVQEGEVELVANGQTSILSKGDIFLSAPYEKFELLPSSSGKVPGFLLINFLPSLFFELDKKVKILRPFDNQGNKVLNIYKQADLPNLDYIAEKANQFNNETLPIEAFSSLVTLLLFELCSAYDKTHHYIPAKFSNEYDLKIYTYIHARALTNLKIEDVMNEFFVSKWYVTKVCKLFYGGGFSFMLKSCKMWAARGLIVNKKHQDFREVASACGYTDYSGFYKAYKDFFGITPKDDLKFYKENKYFYTKKESN